MNPITFVKALFENSQANDSLPEEASFLEEWLELCEIFNPVYTQ